MNSERVALSDYLIYPTPNLYQGPPLLQRVRGTSFVDCWDCTTDISFKRAAKCLAYQTVPRARILLPLSLLHEHRQPDVSLTSLTPELLVDTDPGSGHHPASCSSHVRGLVHVRGGALYSRKQSSLNLYARTRPISSFPYLPFFCSQLLATIEHHWLAALGVRRTGRVFFF